MYDTHEKLFLQREAAPPLTTSLLQSPGAGKWPRQPSVATRGLCRQSAQTLFKVDVATRRLKLSLAADTLQNKMMLGTELPMDD